MCNVTDLRSLLRSKTPSNFKNAYVMKIGNTSLLSASWFAVRHVTLRSAFLESAYYCAASSHARLPSYGILKSDHICGTRRRYWSTSWFWGPQPCQYSLSKILSPEWQSWNCIQSRFEGYIWLFRLSTCYIDLQPCSGCVIWSTLRQQHVKVLPPSRINRKKI